MSPDVDAVRWTLVVPLRALPSAKSRLARTLPGSGDPELHAALVEAIRTETLRAAHAAASVARLLVVSDVPVSVPDGTTLLVQRSEGLNGALSDAADESRRRWPGDGVAALVGDLPALTAAELDEALRHAAARARAFVPDTDGTGTTLLTARAGLDLQPSFGLGSAARHGSTAAPLPAGAGLRHDVDTFDDLAALVDGRAAARLPADSPVRAVLARFAA